MEKDSKTLTLTLDRELHDFFKEYAKNERETMAGILRKHILDLKRAQESQDKLLIVE